MPVTFVTPPRFVHRDRGELISEVYTENGSNITVVWDPDFYLRNLQNVSARVFDTAGNPVGGTIALFDDGRFFSPIELDDDSLVIYSFDDHSLQNGNFMEFLTVNNYGDVSEYFAPVNFSGHSINNTYDAFWSASIDSDLREMSFFYTDIVYVPYMGDSYIADRYELYFERRNLDTGQILSTSMLFQSQFQTQIYSTMRLENGNIFASYSWRGLILNPSGQVVANFLLQDRPFESQHNHDFFQLRNTNIVDFAFVRIGMPGFRSYVNIFDENGNRVRQSFLLSEDVSLTPYNVDLAQLSDGRVVVLMNTNTGVYVQLFTENMEILGVPTLVSATANNGSIDRLGQSSVAVSFGQQIHIPNDGVPSTELYVQILDFGPTPRLGGSGHDQLSGSSDAEEIFTLGGNDTLDGRGGGDTISGGDGDDTIYYYATDLAANITGGAGTDTLLITTASSAPTSFNLAAQGFEQARLELVDTGNNTWATISQLFNASWQILTSNQVNDNASRRFTTYDRANTQTWASSEEDYNTTGARFELRTFYDDGTRRTTGYDVTNAQTYGTYEEDYNAAGARTALRTYYDDGTRRTTGYDTGSLTWSTYEEDYNAAGQRVALRTYDDDGTRRTTQWDPASGQTWSLIEEYFNAAGQRTRQITDYDDGDNTRARLDTVWDVGNTQAWAVQTTQTSNVSVVVRVYGTLDNGSAFG